MPSDTFTFEEASAPDTFSFEDVYEPAPAPAPVKKGLTTQEVLAQMSPMGGEFSYAPQQYEASLVLPRNVELEGFSRPLVPIPRIPQQKSVPAQIGAGVVNTLAGFGEFIESPLGLATGELGATGAAARRILALLYGGQMATQIPESARRAGEVSVTGTPQQKTESYLGTGANIVLPAFLGESALSPAIKSVAVRSPEGEILTGPLGTRHNEIAKEADIPEPPEKDRGFVIETPQGEETVLGTEGRKEALPVAEEAGQVKPDEELTPKLQDLKDEGELHGAMTKPPATVEELANLKAEGDVPEKFGVKSFALEGENPESVLQRAELYRTDSPFGLDLVKQGGFELRDKAPELAGKEELNPTSAAQWAAISDARKGGPDAMREWVDEAFKARREQRKAMADFEDAKTDAEKEDAINRAQTASNQFLNEGLQAVGNWGKEFGVDSKTVDEARRLSAEFSKGAEALTEPVKEVTPLEKETQGKEVLTSPEGFRVLGGGRFESDSAPPKEAFNITKSTVGGKTTYSFRLPPMAKPAPVPQPSLLGQSQDFFNPTALRKLPPEQLSSLAKSLGTEATVPAISRRAKERFEEKQRDILATQPPKTSEIHIQAQEQSNPSHAFGIVAPQSIPLQKLLSGISGPIENIASWAREMWRGFSVKAVPKITDADRVTGENAARLVSAPLAGRAKGIEFARKVMEETGLDDYKLGVAAVEDNLRGLRDERNAEADRLEQQGKTEEAAALREAASDVNSIVGAKHSPFKTESEYQAYINRPDVKAAAAMHRQMWSEQKDPIYRQANDLDPETPLATRGRQLGMRINLKAIMPGETAVRAVGGSSKTLRQLATLKRRDPFAQRAKGTAQQYEGSYTEMMANGFGRELPVAAQHNFIRSLIESGNAQVSDRMYSPDLKIKDEPTVVYLIRLNPWRGKFLQVRRSLANEYEAVSGLDKALDIPILKPFNNFMTRQSVQGLAEGTTHMGNLMTQVFTGLGPTSNPILNAVIKSLGRADLIWQVPKVFIKAMTDQTPRMVELAEIGATKEPYRGQVSKVLLNPIDKSVRVISDDIYKGMAEKGWVEDTETGRREYVNQVGNYHKQLQPVLMRRLRETGLNPFVTAGQTYNVMGLRRMVLAPGAKATSNAAALALRADILGGWVGFVTLVTGINLLTSGKADGPKGTPLGAVGWKDEDGNLHYFNVARWLGYERGPRATGILSAVEAKRAGLSTRQQIESAAGALGSTVLSYLMGPGARFLWISMFGTRPTQPNVQESPKVPPTDSMNPLKTQLAANIKQALIEANPLINSIVDLRSGKGLSDIAQKQASRYSPRQGRTEEYYSKLPKIVERKQLVEYGEDVAKSARKLPLSQRMGYVNKRFSDDGLEFKYRQEAMQEVRRHGVFTHQ